jgi:hypothetical protein
MPLETFIDSYGNEHKIYMQEKIMSCAVASCATLFNLMYDIEFDESHLRLVSQSFEFGYRPHPADVDANQMTTIALLIEKQKKEGIIEKGGHTSHMRIGMRSDAVIQLLKTYHIESSTREFGEVSKATPQNYKEVFKDKIIFLGAITTNGTEHAIIIRDIKTDGTIIVYDSAKGLVELDELSEMYDIFDEGSVWCPIYAEKKGLKKELDLERGPQNF